MRYKLLIFGLIPILLFAQKKHLTHSDYDQWNSIKSSKISNDGNFVTYQIDPQEGDGILYVYYASKDISIEYHRGYNAEFSFDSKYLVFQVKPEFEETRKAKRKELKKEEFPKNDLIILNLSTGDFDTIKNVSKFTMPEEFAGPLAIELSEPQKKKKRSEEKVEETEEEKPEAKSKADKKKKGPKDKMLLATSLDGTYYDTIHFVNEYVYAKKSPRLMYTQFAEKADTIKGVYYYENGVNVVVDTAGKEFKKIALNDNGENMAWMVSIDSTKSKAKKYALRYLLLDEQIESIAIGDEGIPNGYMPSPYSTPVYEESQQFLFFKTTKIPVEPEEDTLALKEEKVKLDIWSWTDTIVQPQQLKNLKRDQEKSYLSRLMLSDKSVVQLEDRTIKVSYDKENIHDWIGGFDDRSTRKSLSWDYPRARDLYIVNVKTGEKILVASNVKTYSRMSPAGKYLYWYDKEEYKWMAYNISAGSTIELSQMKTAIWNEDHDVPSLPSAYGIAGWTKNDDHILIYDEFDIWKVSLANPTEPICITKEMGRKFEKRYRYYSLDYELKYIPEGDVLTQVFDKRSKEMGFSISNYYDRASVSSAELVFGDHSFQGVLKAKDSDKLIYRKGNFVDYPEIYYSNLNFDEPTKLSETNPQQKEYNWGTSELVEWKSKSGDLQGILFKPENFDPNKKYPVIIYFYEKYSDLLNNHFGFKPSASTVNFAYFTSNEYLVFVPDIVYETGSPGRSAFKCVVSGTKEIMKRPYVDSDKMAIQGQSWGGYQVAYLVTRTDLYACAMAGAPVSNMTSAYGGIRWGSGMSREFQYEKGQSRLGLSLWDDTDLYIENSPLFFADEVNTPLLMMHNDNDGAVPWYQGIEYFMALRRLNKPAWLLVYNDEAHNLRKRHNRKDLSLRMSQFFDHYLKDEPAPEWMIKGRRAVDKETDDGFELMKNR